jgi:iron complex transport system substrate-binding protein
MKTSTTLVAMTITMLLLTLPAGAADYTLGIFGNANEDDEINMVDVTYTELIIMEHVDETQLADGKYDGEIDILDVTQIELIILGREKELTLIDSADRIVTVEKPMERIVVHHPSTAEAVKLLGAEDRAVGICNHINEVLFPEMSELPLLGTMGYDIYYEEVFELEPDIFITPKLPIPGFEDLVATLEPEITVVALNFYEPPTMVENIRKLRYILNTKEDGDAFIAFYEGVMNDITEKTAGLTEDEKPRVFLKIGGWTPDALSTFTDTYQTEIAGGINIAADLPGPGFVPEIDKEWLIEQNPDIVTAMIWKVYYPGALGYEVDDTSVAIAAREEIMAMDVFASGKAVEEGKVYLYEDKLMITPRFVVGIAYMAKWFHPGLFGDDFDPQAIHQQYLTDFLGIDYDLDEHGVFGYPEP